MKALYSNKISAILDPPKNRLNLKWGFVNHENLSETSFCAALNLDHTLHNL